MEAKITVGISASGKSTHAREWVAKSPNTRVEINRDTIRRQLAEKDGGTFSWAKWKWNREGEVTAIVEDMIRECKAAKQDVIISDTNLNKARLKTLSNKMKTHGYEVEVIEFPITLDEAWKRDAQRADGVGHSVIAKQYQDWLAYKGRKTYVADVTKPKCILVDIDGTSGHANGKRGMFEWSKVDLDDPDEHVKLIINSLPADVSIIFMSGRDEVCRDLTLNWLTKHHFRNNGLFMRPEKDMRKDTLIKEELFWKYIEPNYNVLFCIDDRPCVVRLYQELGIKTFAVGNQHIEF